MYLSFFEIRLVQTAPQSSRFVKPKKKYHNIYLYNLINDYERTYFLFISFVKARNIATVIVGCSSTVPNDNMLFVGDKETRPFTIGVDGTL